MRRRCNTRWTRWQETKIFTNLEQDETRSLYRSVVSKCLSFQDLSRSELLDSSFRSSGPWNENKVGPIRNSFRYSHHDNIGRTNERTKTCWLLSTQIYTRFLSGFSITTHHEIIRFDRDKRIPTNEYYATRIRETCRQQVTKVTFPVLDPDLRSRRSKDFFAPRPVYTYLHVKHVLSNEIGDRRRVNETWMLIGWCWKARLAQKDW